MKIGLIPGRFQMFTRLHKQLVDLALQECVLVYLYVIGGDKPSGRQPFSPSFREQMIKRIYPRTAYPSLSVRFFESANLDFISYEILGDLDLRDEGHELIIYCGGDRANSYERQLEYINSDEKSKGKNKILTAQVKSIPRIEGISGTTARIALLNNEKKIFKQIVPESLHSNFRHLRKELIETYRRITP